MLNDDFMYNTNNANVNWYEAPWEVMASDFAYTFWRNKNKPFDLAVKNTKAFSDKNKISGSVIVTSNWPAEVITSLSLMDGEKEIDRIANIHFAAALNGNLSETTVPFIIDKNKLKGELSVVVNSNRFSLDFRNNWEFTKYQNLYESDKYIATREDVQKFFTFDKKYINLKFVSNLKLDPIPKFIKSDSGVTISGTGQPNDILKVKDGELGEFKIDKNGKFSFQIKLPEGSQKQSQGIISIPEISVKSSSGDVQFLCFFQVD